MTGRNKIIFLYVKNHIFTFIILFLCILVTSFLSVIYPLMFGNLIDEICYDGDFARFLNIVFTYALIFLTGQVFHFILNMSWAKLMTKFLFDIRKDLFNRVISGKGKYLSSVHSGDVVYRMGPDVEQFMNYIHWNTFYFVANVIRFIFSLVAAAFVFWPMAIAIIIATPIVYYSSKYFSKKVKPLYETINEKNGLLSSWAFEVLKGIKDIKLLSASRNVISDYIGKMNRISRLQIKANVVEIKTERVNSGISLLWQLLFYSLSAFFVVNGNMTLGAFTACLGYYSICLGLFGSINNRMTNIVNNRVGIDRVSNTLSVESERKSGDDIDINGNIKFENVLFSYDDNVRILKGVSFAISSGQKVAIVGRSGEGKTTIANLLLNFYEPNDGNIFLDNKKISDYSISSIRRQIGIVHQDPIIFDGSIRYNLVFHDDPVNDEQIYDALQKAALYDYINTLPDGLDTIIGVHGQGLSGGQKQRIAIARIFLRNPKIVIFDEATSSLDNISENVIKESWDSLCENRTIIVIAHRLSTVMNSEKIFVLDNGVIASEGTHEELLHKSETYQQLFSEQQ